VGAPEPLLYLRADYGHTWEGEIDLINVNAYTIPGVKMRVAHHSHNNWYFGYTCFFPNITFDNVRYFDIVTEEPQPEGYEVNLMLFGKNAECMHLPDAKKPMILGVVDADGDGYIDEPLIDINRDGGWYRAADEPDTMGGFFGKTEFIYDGGSFVGTDKDQTVTKSFRFKEEYDY
jgi:hypothetical protein